MSKLTRREFVTVGAKTAVSAGLAALGLPARPAKAASVTMLWSGALTPTSLKVNARLSGNSTAVRLVVADNEALNNPLKSTAVVANNSNDNIVGIEVSGLTPNTRYYYAIEADGTVDTSEQGTFKTPQQGPFSFTFACSSCAQPDEPEHDDIFPLIAEQDALFFLHMGDLHYFNIDKNDRQEFRDAIVYTAGTEAQQTLYKSMPLAYMWDDHDFGPDNSDANSPGREASRLTYQEFVPHYPLPAGSGNVPIYQAFTIGRVRFILTDLRSERDPSADPDGSNKTMLGAPQKAWFYEELLKAKANGQFIIWVSTVPWIDKKSSEKDSWGGYDTERREVANFLHSNDLHHQMMLLGGDAHMLAGDDGTNSNYSDQAGKSFPVFQVSSLASGSSEKGGPFTEGVFPGKGQFALIDIVDDGDESMTIKFSGRKFDTELLYYEFTVSLPDQKQEIYLPRL